MPAKKKAPQIVDVPGVGTQGIEADDQRAGVYNVIRTDLGTQMLMYRPQDGDNFLPMLPRSDRPGEFVEPTTGQTFNRDVQTARVTMWAGPETIAAQPVENQEPPTEDDTAVRNPPA